MPVSYTHLVTPETGLPDSAAMAAFAAARRASGVCGCLLYTSETKAPQQAERKMEMLDASVDGDLEKFAAALKAAL